MLRQLISEFSWFLCGLIGGSENFCEELKLKNRKSTVGSTLGPLPSKVGIQRSQQLFIEAEPLAAGVWAVQKVLLVLRVFGRRRPFGAAAPLADGPDRGDNAVRAEAAQLPQPRVAQGICSTETVPASRTRKGSESKQSHHSNTCSAVISVTV